MPMPKVTTSVVDLSTRVTTVGTYNSAIIVAAKKGPIDTPTLVTSQTDFLERFTPDEKLEIGWDNALYEAYIYLSQQSNLYVVRSANIESEPALYGGCHIRTYKSALDNEELDAGFARVIEHTPNGDGGVPDTAKKHYDTPDDVLDPLNDAMIIYGSSQGRYNNDLAVTIVTDPDLVKLDGAFIINVYKKDNLVETHTCSLDPSLKNGYGVNCYVENVLKASNYIRADVNDNDALLSDSTAYEVEVTGSYEFKNAFTNYIETLKVDPTITDENKKDIFSEHFRMNRKHTYLEGEYAWVNGVNGGIEGAYGFYKCITAGNTATNAPSYKQADANNYAQVVTDNTCVWELVEVIKDYAVDTIYNAGDIIRITDATDATKRYYYRAWGQGTTSSTDVAETALKKNAVNVVDGTITWVNQVQTVALDSTLKGFTSVKKNAGSTYNVADNNPLYINKYLTNTLEIAKTVSLSNPIGVVDRATGTVSPFDEVVEPIYKGTYTGETEDIEYCLPKASEYDEKGKIIKTSLAGGADGAEPTNVDNIRALKTLKNINDVNIQLIMDGGNTTTEFQNAIEDVCTFRENSCKGIISTPYVNEMGMVTGDPQKDVVDYRRNQLNANTRNLELYTTHQLVYDEFNDRNIFVSPSCFVASRIMSVAEEYGWHWAAAGYNRGVIPSLDVANSFDPSVVDTFSDNQINTIIKEPGVGNVIFDELTLQSKASDLQDAHVSRYVDVYLRPRLKNALKQFLFEFNDEQTRLLVCKMLKTFMDPEMSSRALYDYKIVCDETNNRPRDIQNSIMNVWIFIQVVRLAKFIPIKLIVSPYGVSFDDLVSSVG